MYRTKIVAANWKMNTDLLEGEQLFGKILEGLPDEMSCRVIIAPPFTHLHALKALSIKENVFLAAQNCFYEKAGAFTGEISPLMLKSMGIEYVLIGHSERRQFFNETHEIIKLKLDAALEAGLKPIFCCGEPFEIRRSESQNVFVRMQLEESLFHLEDAAFRNVCLAYEPIWAIGTGVTASPEQAQEMHFYIRSQIAIRYNKLVSEGTPILYGGSIKADNARILFNQDDVDGGLVGGASLDAGGFIEIVKAAC